MPWQKKAQKYGMIILAVLGVVFLPNVIAHAQVLDACPIPPFADGGSSSPNVLLILDHSGSMGNGPGSRWETAKSVLKNTIDANPNIRFGLMRMDGSDYNGQDQIGIEAVVRQGGKMLRPVGTPGDEIKTYIDNHMVTSNTPQTWTVLAETLASGGQYYATVDEGGTRMGKGPAGFGFYEKNYHYPGCNTGGADGGTFLEAPNDYTVGQNAVGSQFFLDRAYVIESQPAGFEAHTAILTRNDDKNNSDASFMILNLPESATVYVAYDSRATTLPTWLQSFTPTGQVVDTSDVNFNIYQKTFDAGQVVLGGNKNGGGVGAGSNYFVYVGLGGMAQSEPQTCDATTTDDYETTIDTTSPILYPCQKSFIILITDGLANFDNDWNVVTSVIGDYDNDGQAGDCANGAGGCTSQGQYVDDVAKYLYDHDMRSDVTGMQNIVTYVVGFFIDDALLSSTATKGGGQYYTASNAGQLTAALQGAIDDIMNQISSGTSVATISTSTESDDLLVRAKFLPGSWKGYLEAFTLPITEGASPVWEAGSVLSNTAPSSRNIFTYLSSETVKKQDFLSTNAALLTHLEETWSVASAEAADRLNYVRGVEFSKYRNRDGWILGDIVYSTPVYIGPPVFFHTENGYPSFKTQHAGRKPIVYVGANDGMLHAFDASDGSEEWAFIPEGAHPNLSTLTSSGCHEYYVDLSSRAADIWDGTSWKTVLCGGGRLSKGEDNWCLDVTDPDASAVSILWDKVLFSNRKATTQPFIGKVRPVDKWVAFFTSGYDESASVGKIAAVDFMNGTKQVIWHNGTSTVNELDLQAKSVANPYYTLTPPNGLDEDNDGYIDLVYAGDTEGSVWKFYYDFVDQVWKKVKIFQTPGQPITSRIILAFGEDGELILYFGTGKYLVGVDKTNTTANSFYKLVENKVVTADANNGHYTSTQTLDRATHLINVTGVMTQQAFDALSDGEKNKAYTYGWYFDLDNPGGNPGERVIEESLVLAGSVFFTSFIPNANVCGFGGNSRLYAIDYRKGVQVDAIEDEVDDPIEYEENKKYEELGAGVPSKPVFYFDKEERKGKVFVQTSDTTIHEKDPNIPDDPISVTYWRQAAE